MKTNTASRLARAFTLIELCVVLAVLAILTAIALPQAYRASLTAKKAEITTNLDGIIVAGMAYEASFDTFGSNSGAWNPGPYYDRDAHPWDDGDIPPIWQALGWSPDGDVRASYYYYPDPLQPTDYLYCHGQSDMDGDGSLYRLRWGYNPRTLQIDQQSVELCSLGGDPDQCF